MDDYVNVIEMMKNNPGAFKKEYTFTKEQSDAINELICKIEDNNFSNSKQKGDALESLIDKVFSLHKIYKISKNLRTITNEIDLFLELEFFGSQMNMNLEQNILDGDTIVECKNYSGKLGVTMVGKFASLMRISKKKTGFFITKNGITGKNSWDSSKGLIRKICLKDDSYIFDFKLDDFKNLENKNLFDLVKQKKQALDLDVNIENVLKEHELEVIFNNSTA